MRDIVLALGFLTRLPVPILEAENEDLAESTRAYPIAGLFVGIASLLALALGAWAFTRPIGAIFAVGAALLITGGLHLDGLADCIDGYLCNGNAERRLAVMHDPRVGGLGAAWIALWLMLKICLVYATIEVGTATTALWCAPILARAPLAWELWWGKPVTPGRGLFGHLSPHVGREEVLLSLASGLVLCVPALWPIGDSLLRFGLAVAGCVIVTLAWSRLWAALLGGLNGDVLGGAVELREMAVLLAMALVLRA